jgi:hypothetical protein
MTYLTTFPAAQRVYRKMLADGVLEEVLKVLRQHRGTVEESHY